jgi:hypothetical protein
MVNRWIPKVKKVLRTKISEHNESLKVLGNPPSSTAECRRILSRLITKVDKKIDALICARDTTTPEFNIAARTRDAALHLRDEVEAKLPKWLGEKYGEKILPLVAETLGYSMSNFVSDPLFRSELHKHFFQTATTCKRLCWHSTIEC